MSDNNNIPQKKDSAGFALQKTGSLLNITDKILENRTQKAVVESDAWLDELIAWADEQAIPDYYFYEHEEFDFVKYWRGFPGNKTQIVQLTELNLCDCQLSYLPKAFGKLTNLTSLDLSFNKFIELPELIGNLKKLTCFNFYGNTLTNFPESLGNLTNLTKLEKLSLGGNGNEFTELPKWIGELTNLTKLNLPYSQLIKLPKSMANLTKLKELDLRGNPIKSLPPELSHLRDITHFD
jgi:Leucine-rich repeat (LRR) protein